MFRPRSAFTQSYQFLRLESGIGISIRRRRNEKEKIPVALQCIVRNYNHDMKKLRLVDMTYYILRKDGAYAGVSLWEGYEGGKPHKIAVHDGTRRAEKTVALF